MTGAECLPAGQRGEHRAVRMPPPTTAASLTSAAWTSRWPTSLALPGGSTLSVRALTTWVGEQMVEDTPGSVPINIAECRLVANGLFLPNYQPAARWRGNMSITWNIANFSLTPEYELGRPGHDRQQRSACARRTSPTRPHCATGSRMAYTLSQRRHSDGCLQGRFAVGYSLLPRLCQPCARPTSCSA